MTGNKGPAPVPPTVFEYDAAEGPALLQAPTDRQHSLTDFCRRIGAHVFKLPPALPVMKTIDEMLHLDLLTTEQHRQIGAWIASAGSPEDILKMPTALWQAVERASEVMGIDNDLTRPPLWSAGDALPG